METENHDCMDSKTAVRYLIEHGEYPLHLPENFELWKELRIKQNDHSEDYINQRIKLIKYLWCIHAKSDILRAYSRDKIRTRDNKMTAKEEKEAIRIIKEAEELLKKTRDIDKYHNEGAHWWENKNILSDYVVYLSAVYQIPTYIMHGDHTNDTKPWWQFW